MLGANIRNRVKQSALVVSDTEFNLFGGLASTGHRKFITAYGEGVATQNYARVPLLIETLENGSGAWQTAIGILNLDTVPATDVERVHTLTVYETSTGAALALTPGATVYVSVVPLGEMYHRISVRPMANNVETWSGSAAIPPFLTNNGLIALGGGTYVSGENAGAFGENCQANHAHAHTFGYGAGSNRPGSSNLSSDLHKTVFTTHTGQVITWRGTMSMQTTDATPIRMRNYIDGVEVASSSTFFVDAGVVTIEAIVSAISTTGVRKVWKLSFVAKTDQNFTTTALIGTPTKTELYEDAGATTWDINPVLVGLFEVGIEVTGQAATSIHWGAKYDGLAHIFWLN